MSFKKNTASSELTVRDSANPECYSGNGDPISDFGNTYYNDHHYHWGYFIHAAAIIGHLDPHWLLLNKDWVDTLVRDAANPTASDPYFPFSRMFDWFQGHSWAKGLFESADGKDEESSSEDAFFAYAMKLWGSVIGDKSMEARGNLMLAIMKRTFRDYFLLESGNRNQPPLFVDNTVTGIASLFSSLGFDVLTTVTAFREQG